MRTKFMYIDDALKREHAELVEAEKVYKDKLLKVYDERFKTVIGLYNNKEIDNDYSCLDIPAVLKNEVMRITHCRIKFNKVIVTGIASTNEHGDYSDEYSFEFHFEGVDNVKRYDIYVIKAYIDILGYIIKEVI